MLHELDEEEKGSSMCIFFNQCFCLTVKQGSNPICLCHYPNVFQNYNKFAQPLVEAVATLRQSNFHIL